ncbi:Chromatin assembly factor 1, subunit A [Actinomortierella ambigua]|nr:Chromatin assembly factor 1, subunit A [Actinomortierella ambigua]
MKRTLSSFFQKDTSKSNESSSSSAKEKNDDDSKQDNPFLETASGDARTTEDGKENIITTPTKRGRRTTVAASTSDSSAKPKRGSTKGKKESKASNSKDEEGGDQDVKGKEVPHRPLLLAEVSIPILKSNGKARATSPSPTTAAATAATTTTDSTDMEMDSPRKGAKKASKAAAKISPKDAVATTSSIAGNPDVTMTPASPTSSSAKDQPQDKPEVTHSQPAAGGPTLSSSSSSPLFVCKVNKVDTASMFRVRNGKAAITEGKLQFLKHPSTIMDLARFHHYREELQEQSEDQLMEAGGVTARLVKDSLSGKTRVEILSIPEEHLGVIAKLIEESELTLVDLSEHVTRVLCPMEFETYEHYDLQKAAKATAAAAAAAASATTTAGVTDKKDTENPSSSIPATITTATTISESPETQPDAHSTRYSTQVSRAAVLDAIQKVAHRVNYGIPAANLPPPSNASLITPANLSIYRWETKAVDRYYTKELRSAVLARREKRMEASAALLAWFLGLELKQQQELCPVSSFAANLAQIVGGGAGGSLGGTGLGAGGAASGASAAAAAAAAAGGGAVGMAAKRKRTSVCESMEVDEDMSSLTKMAKAYDGSTMLGSIAEMNALLLQQPSAVEAMVDPAIVEAKLKEAEAKKKESELKEERRLEKERKMAERQLERDQKEAEKQQREEAKKKREEEDRLRKEQTAQRFVGFFKQAQPMQAKRTAQQQEADNMKQANPSLAGFFDLFQPFHVKANATLAPINRFARPLAADFEQLVLSPTDVDLDGASSDAAVPMPLEVDQARRAVRVMLRRSSLVDHNKMDQDSNYHSSKKKAVPQEYRTMTVKELIQSGVLLQDQDEDPESMFNHKSIPALKMRLIQFAENYRPAYYGTWSKRSDKVTGRRHLGRDTDMLDYDFDSEAEWEEDEEGEELKSDDDEEEDEMSDQEEEDDWLVPEGYLSEDEGLDQEGEEGGRKERAVKKAPGARKPLLAQLVPVIVGPIYQETLGVCTHPALDPFQIEFIGDFEMGSSPFAVDTMAMEDISTAVV